MTTQNSSVIQCPECGKSLVGIGYKVVRIHPVPKWINENGYRFFGYWVLMTPFLLYWMALDMTTDEMRGLAFVWFGLVGSPAVVLYFVPRFFNAYKVIDCPYCGYHEEEKLGKVQNV